jgi:hypothetical protein
MKIIDEIIEELADRNNRLTDILIKTKILAYKLKNSELKDWVDSELNGYSKNTLPAYRVLHCQVIGTLSNGFKRAQNYPIPLNGLDKELREGITTIFLFQSISTLDDFLNNKNEGELVNHISPEHYGYLSKDLDNGFYIEYAVKKIDRLQIVQVMTSVKTKLLDFLLRLNEEIGEAEDIKPFTEGKEKDMVSSLFNSAVFGNNTTIIVGDHNTQTVSNITKGNFDSLAKLLSDNGVPKNEINELKTIIDNDNQQPKTREFGDKVKSWVSKMISKAMDNSWKIGLGAAGKLLADAIEMYYGWK